jgi:hypothetical protein
MNRQVGQRRTLFKVTLFVIVLILGLVVVDVIYSLFAFAFMKQSFTLITRTSQNPMQFEKRSGFVFASEPIRVQRIINGETEYTATVKGNRQGFLDSSDFVPRRPRPQTRRFVVMGDSFTAAHYLNRNWPERAEQLARERGLDVEFLNFGLDGTGLANWYHVYKEIIVQDGYEIDGVILTVAGDDLIRRFTVLDATDSNYLGIGRAPSWDPSTWPTTREESRSFVGPLMIHIVDNDTFDRSLASHRSWFRLQLWHHLSYEIRLSLHARPSEHDELNDPQRVRVMREFALELERRGVPSILAFIPYNPHHTRSQKTVGRRGHQSLEANLDFESFRDMLNATEIDFSQRFEPLSEAEIRDLYFKIDWHWNQNGSDLFAEYALDQILAWDGHRSTSSAGSKSP